MPIAELKFSLPEEQYDFDTCVRAGEFRSSLIEIENHIRSCLKHGHQYKCIDEALEAIRNLIPEDIHE